MAATNLIAKLTSIADAIREKTGESGVLSLDAMAAAIAALETGGGAKVACGSFVLATSSSSVTIEHGLDAIPTFIHLWMPTDMAMNSSFTSSTNFVRTHYLTESGEKNYEFFFTKSSTSYIYWRDNLEETNPAWTIDNTKFTATSQQQYSGGPSLSFKETKVYKWIAVADSSLLF